MKASSEDKEEDLVLCINPFVRMVSSTKRCILSKVLATTYRCYATRNGESFNPIEGKQMRNTRFLALAGILVAGLITCEFALSARKGGNSRQLTAAVLPTVEAVKPEEPHAAANEAPVAQSISLDFTMVALEVFQPVEGQPLRRAERTFYSRSDGSFATVVISYDKAGAVSSRETIVGEIGRGLFRVSETEKKLIFIAPLPQDASSPFSDDLKSNPNYHGEDSVLGYRTVILRKQRKDYYTDLYYTPELKSIIKTVAVSLAGTTTIEATLITPGPVNSAIFAALATFSIDTSVYSKKLEKLGRIEGESALAREVSKQIADATKPRTSF